jgi:hypothetical protein
MIYHSLIHMDRLPAVSEADGTNNTVPISGQLDDYSTLPPVPQGIKPRGMK